MRILSYTSPWLTRGNQGFLSGASNNRPGTFVQHYFS